MPKIWWLLTVSLTFTRQDVWCLPCWGWSNLWWFSVTKEKQCIYCWAHKYTLKKKKILLVIRRNQSYHVLLQSVPHTSDLCFALFLLITRIVAANFIHREILLLNIFWTFWSFWTSEWIFRQCWIIPQELFGVALQSKLLNTEAYHNCFPQGMNRTRLLWQCNQLMHRNHSEDP